MKKIILSAVVAFMLIAAPSFARMKGGGKGMDGDGMGMMDMEGMSVEQLKEKSTMNIDKRIGMLQEMKTCVEAAKDKPALKMCRDKHRQAMEEMKKEWKKDRKGKMK